MNEARPGDLVFHYSQGSVRGISTVTSAAREAPRPYRSDDWTSHGRILEVDFAAFDLTIPLEEIPLEARRSEPKPHAAFASNGNVNQGYFFRLSFSLAQIIANQADVTLEHRHTDEREIFLVDGLTDREGIARIRIEQPQLRRRLLDRSDAPNCGLCGRTVPADYLVAAHIKPRAKCSPRERRDPNVAMLACLFGCDAAFERGHLRVDSQGQISLHSPSSTIDQHFAHLSGTTAPVFSKLNRKYFEAHRRQHSAER
jgi:5-methylcytosine-specific restriction endonuclease McrA